TDKVAAEPDVDVTPGLDQEAPSGVSMRVEGMDCASCVGKIETALARLPDVSDIQLNFATEKLELTLAPDSVTKVGDIEKIITSLGFGVVATTRQAQTQSHGVRPDNQAFASRHWWQTRKGKLVVSLAILMSAAY